MRQTLFIIFVLLTALTSNCFALPGENIKLKTDKSTISLSNYKGSVIYLDFWASWCKPCRKSFPWMNKIHAQYKSKGLKVLAVNVDKQRSEANRFLEMVDADFQIAYDAKGELPTAFKLKAMPSSYLIDKNGNIVKTHLGFKEKNTAAIEKEIRALLMAQ